MRCAVIVALLCLASLALFANAANLLEVSKTVEAGPKTGVYTVTIGYKVIGAPGRVANVNIADSLPEELDLVSGDLVVKAEDPSTEEWYYHSYQVKNKNVHLTIAEPEAVVELPPAEVSYTTGGNAVSTVSTDAVPLVIGVPFPKGTFNLTPVIAFFTLALPVLAAVYLIPYFSTSQLKKRK
ncbi:uncharacterized protein ACA1_097160 [Acanthamoeba castellanii str. Neff]|uniref:Uncharacterized protein n=1 Tax=Acanthamoeba castellanii (strain ATCC 30010 / Neff) TaxID=1257118 RepID=L8GJ46_ACACF|nr:uncharacterized protein ACA1_097160 [Acanthamoeba castellanii str. Neff]ELR13032.1 hypothetical protein ACA1_097160 [Acanthamoeba castellanii str. Neff]